MEPARERELVDRCRREEPGAFEELVDQFKNLVFALIARTVQDRSRVEDLAQDVFLRIHRGLPYFRGEARLATWIYRIVVNVCAQEKSVARVSVSIDDPDSHIPAPRSPFPADAEAVRDAVDVVEERGDEVDLEDGTVLKAGPT